MRSKHLLLLLAMSAFIGPACSTQDPNNNAAGHSGMEHNAANKAAADQSTTGDHAVDHGKMDHSAMQSSPNAAAADYDLQFIDTMIAHHQGAIDMAKVIGSRAEHAEIKTLGRNIMVSQQKEIDQMRSWREKWFAGKPLAINMEMPGMGPSMSGMDMSKLESLSGNAFDLEFIKQMIPHHEGAVVMSNEALQRSRKDEIKKLADAIIKAQESEIKQMRSWQADWSK